VLNANISVRENKGFFNSVIVGVALESVKGRVIILTALLTISLSFNSLCGNLYIKSNS
jgi:hypothetical protein